MSGKKKGREGSGREKEKEDATNKGTPVGWMRKRED